MTRFEEVKALRELGATSVEFGPAGELVKVTFAVQQPLAVVRPPAAKPEAQERQSVTPEELKERLRRRELTGR